MNPNPAVHEVICNKSFVTRLFRTSCGFSCGACNVLCLIRAKLPYLFNRLGLPGCVQSRCDLYEEAISGRQNIDIAQQLKSCGLLCQQGPVIGLVLVMWGSKDFQYLMIVETLNARSGKKNEDNKISYIFLDMEAAFPKMFCVQHSVQVAILHSPLHSLWWMPQLVGCHHASGIVCYCVGF